MSDNAQTIPTKSSEDEVDVEMLRDTLKRCSKETLEAALAYRETGDFDLVPTVVFGIVERFLEPEHAEKLNSGEGDLRFMEDLGLDSLTMIEAIMMVEESLNITIKNEELMNLRTVEDLKEFIDNKVRGIEVAPQMEKITLAEIASIMPHQDPFLFLREAEIGNKVATGSYQISGNEDFLKGHFKDNPVFPASILLEALGQLAVLYMIKKSDSLVSSVELDANTIYFTGLDGVRCHRVCKPGDTLDMEVKLAHVHEPLVVFKGVIKVGGEKAVVAEEIKLAFSPVQKSVEE